MEQTIHRQPRPSSTYALWNRLPDNIVGSVVFSVGMCARVPYFASVLPRVTTLRPGTCVVTAPKWWGVRNHLGTFHAIASCNLAEVAMGMLAEATVPSSHRWIPKGMTVAYLKPGTTRMTATAHLDEIPDWSAWTEGAELVVPVAIRDRDGREVVHADITVWVTPKS